VVQAVGLTELLEWMEADALSLIAACLPDIYLRLPWWGWARVTACPILSPLEEPACWLVWKYFEAKLAVQYVPTLGKGYISTVAMAKRSFAAPHHVRSYQSTVKNPAPNNKPIKKGSESIQHIPTYLGIVPHWGPLTLAFTDTRNEEYVL
jgi:hypothetical protein